MRRLSAALLCAVLLLGAIGVTWNLASLHTEKSLLAQLSPKTEARVDRGLQISGKRFPDKAFREYVREALDTDGDGFLSDAERAAVTTIDLNGRGVSSLEGVKYFTRLRGLYAANNALTWLDLDKNKRLAELDVSDNRLEWLNLPKSADLVIVNAANNQLPKLDVTRCAGLIWLNVSENRLKALNLSGNGNLVRLNCQNNQLTKLSVGHNPRLSVLKCSGNSIAQMDAATFSDALYELVVDDELCARKRKAVTWYGSPTLNVAIPAKTTLFDGSRILYGASNLLNRKIDRNRDNFADLTDAQFANFRNVDTTGMGQNALFRSSSPIRTGLSRNREADAAARAAGIRTAINLSDRKKQVKRLEGYKGSYYSTLKLWTKDVCQPQKTKAFGRAFVQACRFMAKSEGPYLVHCVYGRDRTGLACAILECLMGANANEVVGDFMETYANYMGIQPDTEAYDYIAKKLIAKQLAKSFHIKSIFKKKVDLAACAEEYLLEYGMTAEEIEALKAALAKDYR